MAEAEDYRLLRATRHLYDGMWLKEPIANQHCLTEELNESINDKSCAILTDITARLMHGEGVVELQDFEDIIWVMAHKYISTQLTNGEIDKNTPLQSIAALNEKCSSMNQTIQALVKGPLVLNEHTKEHKQLLHGNWMHYSCEAA